MSRPHSSAHVSRRAFLKAIFTSLGVIGAVPLLAACGVAPAATPTAAPPAAPTTAPVAAAATTAPAAAPTAVAVPASTISATTAIPGPEQANIDWQQFKDTQIRWIGGPHNFSVAVQAMVPEFQALTGIGVTVEVIAWDAYNQKRQFDLSSSAPQYDAYLANDGQFDWLFGPAGQLADPNEFINDPKLTDKAWYDLQDVSPKLMAAASWDGVPGHKVGSGKQWVIPFMQQSSILAYRDDLFQKYKLVVPKTLEDVVTAAKAISEGEKANGIAGFATRGQGVAEPLAKLMPEYGAADFDANVNCTLSSDESIYLHDLMINKIIKPYGPAGWENLTWDDGRHQFAQGSYGMFFEDDYFAALYEDPTQSKVAGKVKYANLGGPKGMFTDAYYFGTAIGQNGKNKGAAWLLAQWLTSKKAMRDVTVKYHNLMPTRLSTFNDPGFKELVGSWGGGSWFQAVNLVTNQSGLSAFTPTDQPDAVRTSWSNAAQKIYEGAPVKDTLAATANDINATLEKSGFRKKSG